MELVIKSDKMPDGFTGKVIVNGTVSHYVDGLLHREDGPAIERSAGSEEWYIRGKRHRADGPAFISVSGIEIWYFEDKLHREDGPAYTWVDGSQAFYFNGKQITVVEFFRTVYLSKIKNGSLRTAIIDGVEHVILDKSLVEVIR